MPPKQKALSELSGNSILKCQQKLIKNPLVENPIGNPAKSAEKTQKTGSKKSCIEANRLAPLPQFDPFKSKFVPHRA